MSKTLVIAEKPSVARDIARVLGVSTTGGGEGCFTSDKWVISWAIGHLVALSEPDEIDPQYKKWRMEALPIMPESIPLRVLSKTKAQFSVLKKLMQSADTAELVCATDSGREGELIFRYIYAQAGCKKPWKRLWISSMTDEAIRAGFAGLRPGHDYDRLYDSAKCRSEADWLVGMNASRAYTLQYGALLSVGRVQTPTLALICARDAEIAAFVPQDYYEVHALFAPPDTSAKLTRAESRLPAAQPGEYTGALTDKPDSETVARLDDADKAASIAAAVRGHSAEVERVTRQNAETPPPQLYDLTSLQRDANRLLGLSAQQTLNAVQALYEKHKAVTYPRTDSRCLTHDMAAEIPQTFGALPPEYKALLPDVSDTARYAGNKRIFDDAKVSDHHALIPTKKRANTAHMSDVERRVFDLIARRFIAAFCAPYKYIKTVIITRVGEHRFVTRGTVPVSLGWKAVYAGVDDRDKSGEGEGDAGALPDLHKGDRRFTRAAVSLAKKTQPPKPYTDATLLSAMENAGRAIEDEALRDAMKENGLGTPATRAAIIERLIDVGYVQRTGKALRATPKAMSLMQVLPEQLKSAETTGRWERALGNMARGSGTVTPQAFMDSIKRFTVFIVEDAKQKRSGVEFEPRQYKGKKAARATHYLTGAKCPDCGARILETERAYGCERWREGCKFTLWKNALSRSGVDALPQDAARGLINGETVEIKGARYRMQNGRPAPVSG